MKEKRTSDHLSAFLNFLQANGRYTFTEQEVIEALHLSGNAFKLAIYRLIAKKGKSEQGSMQWQSRRTLRNIILSSEIQRLPDLEGYLAVPGDYPVGG